MAPRRAAQRPPNDALRPASAGAAAAATATPHTLSFDAPAGPLAELFVLRHGERADRVEGRAIVDQWVDDTALTKHGRETAKLAGSALSSMASSPWAAVYSSPFFRCLQTANEVAAELGLPVRIEPGLAEFCSHRIFDQEPNLRRPRTALRDALTRADADTSAAPVRPSLPQWPEGGGDATARVVTTARSLAARHPGRAVCLVCHSHSVVEITRHLPLAVEARCHTVVRGKAKGKPPPLVGCSSEERSPKAEVKQAGSRPDYCGLSHISPAGGLIRCLDIEYLKFAHRRGAGAAPDARPTAPTTGGEDGYRPAHRVIAAEEIEDGSLECDAVDMLLELELDEVLARHPEFSGAFARGSTEQQDLWRRSWARREEPVRHKLKAALATGIFGPPGAGSK